MDFTVVLEIVAALLLFWLAKGIIKVVLKALLTPVLIAVIMRKKMSVTVKLNGAVIIQQVMRLGTLNNEEKLLEVIGQAIDNSPLAGAKAIGEPREEKVGKFGRRLKVLVCKDRTEAEFTLEMLPAVV